MRPVLVFSTSKKALSSLTLGMLAWGGSLQLPAAEGLAQIAAREVARRTDQVNAARDRQAEASALMGEGKAAEAMALYQELLETVPESPISAGLREELKAGFATAACAHAQKLLSEGRYAEAGKALDAALALRPEDKAVLKLKKQAADPDRFPPALTPDHVNKVAEVEKLLLMAGSSLELGDYNRAEKSYESVLRLDQTNVAARRGLERVEAERAKYYDAARDHRRAKSLNAISALWEDPLPPASNVVSQANMGAGSVLAQAKLTLEKKLRTLIIPKVEFTGASLDEVIEYLRITTKDVDPEGRGIDFVVNADEIIRQNPLTLTLIETPVEDILRYTVNLAGAAYRIDSRAVIITSLSEKSTNMVNRTFIVPPDFISSAPVDAAPGAADPFAAAQPAAATSGLVLKRMSALEFLKSRGVLFAEGASASFNPTTSTLIVRNTQDNINLIETLVDQANKTAPKQAKITVRMLIVTQKNLDELGTNFALGQFNLPGSSRIFGSGGGQIAPDTGARTLTDGLRPGGEIAGKASIDQLLSIGRGQDYPLPTDSSPSAFRLLGVLTDPRMETALYALAQKKGTDVMASPTLVAKSGQKASVRVVREFPFPTEFDPPEIPQTVGNANNQTNSPLPVTIVNANGQVTSNNSNSAPITPTTPTAFEVKECGFVLEVEPVISEDGRTVELSVAPSNTDFEGFVDYGSDISNQLDDFVIDPVLGGFVNRGVRYIVDNPILQPVFRKDSLSTSVIVWDGSTIVLGGVAKQEVTSVNDKVPLLGDIPLVGRTLQSKMTQTITKNVLFFVTVDVIDPAGRKVNEPLAAASPVAAP